LSQEDLHPFYEFINHCRIRLEARVVRLFKTLDKDLRSDAFSSFYLFIKR